MQQHQTNRSRTRLRAYKLMVVCIGLLIGLRLFQIQVIRHDYYLVRAEASQLKQFEIEPKRGEIYALDGTETVPIVINQTLKKLIADPRLVGNADETVTQLIQVTGGDSTDYLEKLSRDTAYVELEEALELDVADRVSELELKGIALRDTTQRVYPEGGLAAHVLGFVNADGEGQYGIEQYHQDLLSGTPGLLSGTFDVRGVPVAVADNIDIAPVDGADIVLSIDRTIQRQTEKLLAEGLKEAQSDSGSVVVMDPKTGKIKALANFPTYSPAEFNMVEDIGVFINNSISSAYEPGSVVKPFTMSMGLNQGIVTPESTYYDPGYEVIDGFRVRNAGTSTAKTRTMTEVITRSVNTGVIHVLKNSNGNGEIDSEDKQLLYDFFTDQLGFGNVTNIELAGESSGSITEPEGSSDVKYANMTFGQGVSMNMIHLAAGTSALINGGTYYQPSIVDSYVYENGAKRVPVAPKVVRESVISEAVSEQIKYMMETVVESGGGYAARRSGYVIGGKTGTAQLPNPDGGYFEDRDTGSFVGFGAGANGDEYVIVVRVDNPQIAGFAGSQGAAPIFADISNWLINYYGISPQKGVN